MAAGLGTLAVKSDTLATLAREPARCGLAIGVPVIDADEPALLSRSELPLPVLSRLSRRITLATRVRRPLIEVGDGWVGAGASELLVLREGEGDDLSNALDKRNGFVVRRRASGVEGGEDAEAIMNQTVKIEKEFCIAEHK
jgi:hypothetical protein